MFFSKVFILTASIVAVPTYNNQTQTSNSEILQNADSESDLNPASNFDWRKRMDDDGKLGPLRALSIIQFIMPTSALLPPIFGMVALWEEPQEFGHYGFYKYFIVNSLLAALAIGVVVCTGWCAGPEGCCVSFVLGLFWIVYVCTLAIGWTYAFGEKAWTPEDMFHN